MKLLLPRTSSAIRGALARSGGVWWVVQDHAKQWATNRISIVGLGVGNDRWLFAPPPRGLISCTLVRRKDRVMVSIPCCDGAKLEFGSNLPC